MQIHSILFAGRRNIARSLMAEACFNAAEVPGWRAFSAGWEPQPRPDRIAMQVLERNGFATARLSSKPVAIFLQPGAPEIDLCVFMDPELPDDAGDYPGQHEFWRIQLPDPAPGSGMNAVHEQMMALVAARISSLILSGRLGWGGQYALAG